MELTARIVTLRLAETFVIARESSDKDDVVQVELTHVGVTGFGEGAPIERYDESGASALAYLEGVGPRLGDDPFALEEIESRLPQGENAARAALDGALHDLQGKLLGVPVWRLLGLPRTGPPTSWTVWLGDPDDMARRAQRAAARFARLKLKLGGGDGLDVERVRAVRVGDPDHRLCRQPEHPGRATVAAEDWRGLVLASVLPARSCHRHAEGAGGDVRHDQGRAPGTH